MHEHEHPEPTRRSGYRYRFTAKHHGGGSASDARWLPDLSEADEFAVFDDADELQLADEGGNLYGALRDGVTSLRYLGTWQQQLAEFPCASAGSPWHGYPAWPLNEEAASNRRGEKCRPPREVFDRMVATGLITAAMRKRLKGGNHV
jgi:hypothetical protein